MVAHIQAKKIAQAVWGSRDFKKPIDEVKLLKEESTEETRRKKVIATLKRKGVI